MNDWNRPVSEYRGEFKWNYKEGFNREGRREKDIDRLSADLKQLRLAKKREKEQKETAGNDSLFGKTTDSAVIIDTHGDEYEVCETAKEALERLIKSDHRLASKYQNHVKKLDARLKPYGTSYQGSFMKSSNVFPTVKAYEMAAEEFEKNQDVLERADSNSKSRILAGSEWESSLANYGNTLGTIREEPQDHSNHIVELQQDEPGSNRDKYEDGELMRQKWVDTAHLELSRTFKENPQTTEEMRKRSEDIVPLWLRRGLQRQGLI
ncbi:hypothetical protein GE061_011168 [Apolygus lucorum]|uniref:Uncharacterized protein n=1 Tax=Apolygus lucorum TaxID=248454 RepID=A0A6A4KAI6_APOLU|nr:hypothetical protein GE061_011168 [Apolygus lucorum]